VVVDQRPQLTGDGASDLADVHQLVQLAGEALQQLEVGERTNVALAADRGARLIDHLLVEQDHAVPALGLGGQHRRLRVGQEIAWVHRVLGTL
jgi:hypothetical protein